MKSVLQKRLQAAQLLEPPLWPSQEKLQSALIKGLVQVHRKHGARNRSIQGEKFPKMNSVMNLKMLLSKVLTSG